MERSSFQQVLKGIQEILGIKPLITQLPLGQESSFRGIIDLITMKAVVFDDDAGGGFKEEAIPEEMKAQAEEMRGTMIEDIAESSDTLLEKYLEGAELSSEEIFNALKQGILSCNLFPVLCGSAINNIALQPVLNLIANCFPSPADRSFKGINPATQKEEERRAGTDDSLALFVFKTVADPYAGKLTIFRVLSGVLNSDSIVYNATKGVKERIGQVLKIEGKNQKAINPAIAGDIAAVAKLKETATGDTCCDEKHPFTYKRVELSEPVMQLAVEPKSKGDEDKLISSLARLMEEDSTLRTRRDGQTHEFILEGMGQTHLDVAIEKMQRKFGLALEVKTPKVAYKETVRGSAKGQGKLKKQSGGRGQYGHVQIEMEPLEPGGGFEFVNKIVGGSIPREYISPVEKGMKEALENGVLAGYPMVDIRVTLIDGSYHEVDSSEMAFKIAGSMALKNGAKKAKSVLLEPIMSIEVVTPEEYMGDVIGDLNSRRGKVQTMTQRANVRVVAAQVPLSSMFGYATDLRSKTQGRATYTMQFSHYDEIPKNISEDIVTKVRGG